MLNARKRMESIGFMRPGEQPYFYVGAPVLVLGFTKPPSGNAWDAVVPDEAFAGRLAKAYRPGEDMPLSGPLARTIHAKGVKRIYNLFGLLCGLNGFAVWLDAPDEHGRLLYVVVNDGTRTLPEDPPCLTERIEAGPSDAWEDAIIAAVQAHLFDNATYVETSLTWKC